MQIATIFPKMELRCYVCACIIKHQRQQLKPLPGTSKMSFWCMVYWASVQNVENIAWNITKMSFWGLFCKTLMQIPKNIVWGKLNVILMLVL